MMANVPASELNEGQQVIFRGQPWFLTLKDRINGRCVLTPMNPGSTLEIGYNQYVEAELIYYGRDPLMEMSA